MTEYTYKTWIDEFVARASGSVIANRIRATGHSERTSEDTMPLSEAEQAMKNFLLSLDDGQRSLIARLLEGERISAFHDALCLLEDQSMEDIDLRIAGERIVGSPYATFHYDFICRLEGDSWPDERVDL